jgi:hypothetical protein
LLVASLAYFSTLKVEEVNPKTLANLYQTAAHQFPEHGTVNGHRRVNVKSSLLFNRSTVRYVKAR